MGAAGSPIVQLAFSPRENMLAWTDMGGIFTRWHDAVPSSFTDPNKQPFTNGAATTSLSRKELDLFGEEAAGDGLGEPTDDLKGNDVDMDIGIEGVDDDWIIDDVGDGLQDAPEAVRKWDGGDGVREMGKKGSNSFISLLTNYF